MGKFILVATLSLLPWVSVCDAAMSGKQLYAASMENDAQFIECVGNIFFAVASFQRVLLEDLKWEDGNPEYQKIKKSKESFKKASASLVSALDNSDRLVKELTDDKRKKFEVQLGCLQKKIAGRNLVSEPKERVNPQS